MADCSKLLVRHTETKFSELQTRALPFVTSTAGGALLVGVEFNATLDTIQVISEVVFTANHLTDIDKQNSTEKYR